MAKIKAFVYRGNSRKKRKGVHSKNASRGQSGYKKKYKGQTRCGSPRAKRIHGVPQKVGIK